MDRAPTLPGVECFRARDLVHHHRRHSHEAYSIGVIEDGIRGNSCRGSTHRHPPGTIVAMNPDEAHTGFAVDNKPLSYRMFYVSPEALRGIWFRDVGIKDPDSARELLDFHSHWEAFHDEFFTESAFTRYRQIDLPSCVGGVESQQRWTPANRSSGRNGIRRSKPSHPALQEPHRYDTRPLRATGHFRSRQSLSIRLG